MTIKENITQEFLDSAGDPARLEQIFRRFGHTKGPLYGGLAQATSQMELRFEEAVSEVFEAEAEKQGLQQQLDSLREQKQELGEDIHSLDLRLLSDREEHGQVQELLDRAQALTQRGFGQEELNRLYDLLAQVAAAQGEPPELGVAQFFQTVERYERVVSFDLETTRAGARVAQAEADAVQTCGQ